MYTCRLMSNFILDPQMDVVKVIWPCPSAATIFFKCNFCIVVPRYLQDFNWHIASRGLYAIYSWTSCSTTRRAWFQVVRQEFSCRMLCFSAIIRSRRYDSSVYQKLNYRRENSRNLKILVNCCRSVRKTHLKRLPVGWTWRSLSHRLRLNRIPLLDQES